MARPRSFKTDEVLTKVTELFWAQGFEAVSIQDIAEATGLRPGSIHAAFGNKDDLFALAFERYGDHFRACMQVSHTGLEGAKEYLDRLVVTAASDPDRKGCLIINTAGELAAHDDPVRQAVQDRLEGMKSFFRDRMAEERNQSDQAVHALFGAAVSVLVLARAKQPEKVLRDITAAALLSAKAAQH